MTPSCINVGAALLLVPVADGYLTKLTLLKMKTLGDSVERKALNGPAACT